jgi:hypothetical protein
MTVLAWCDLTKRRDAQLRRPASQGCLAVEQLLQLVLINLAQLTSAVRPQDRNTVATGYKLLFAIHVEPTIAAHTQALGVCLCEIREDGSAEGKRTGSAVRWTRTGGDVEARPDRASGCTSTFAAASEPVARPRRNATVTNSPIIRMAAETTIVRLICMTT